jgi:FG-GAP-like repeat
MRSSAAGDPAQRRHGALHRLGRRAAHLGRIALFAALQRLVNGDGALDLVLGAARGSGASLVLLNDGTGHFATVPNALPLSALGDNSEGLGVGSGDINGDGRTDLVLAATKGDPFYEGAWLQVAIGNGDGTFRDETSTRLPGESVDSSPRWIAFPQLVDVNGDGKPDLLTHFDGSGGASPAYVNDGTGVFRPLNTAAYRGGLYAFVNDKPHQAAHDVLAVSEGNGAEILTFYRRIK